jgi:hypothetical protein
LAKLPLATENVREFANGNAERVELLLVITGTANDEWQKERDREWAAEQ